LQKENDSFMVFDEKLSKPTIAVMEDLLDCDTDKKSAPFIDEKAHVPFELLKLEDHLEIDDPIVKELSEEIYKYYRYNPSQKSDELKDQPEELCPLQEIVTARNETKSKQQEEEQEQDNDTAEIHSQISCEEDEKENELLIDTESYHSYISEESQSDEKEDDKDLEEDLVEVKFEDKTHMQSFLSGNCSLKLSEKPKGISSSSSSTLNIPGIPEERLSKNTEIRKVRKSKKKPHQSCETYYLLHFCRGNPKEAPSSEC